jgi:AraC-like DNA-binding protein
MTFQAYHRARRMGLALREVRKGSRVSEAKDDSGFESDSGFREAFTRIFGDAPSVAKERGGLFAERIETPLGTMLAVAGDEGLRLLEFTDRRALERELTILRQRLKTNVVPDSIRISMRSVRSWRPTSRARTWTSTCRLRLSAPTSSAARGICCARFRRARRVPIPGWRTS